MNTAAGQFRFWVDLSLECVRRDHTPALSSPTGDQRGPFLTARALGMALAALNDANALASGRSPLLNITATPGLASLTGDRINVASGAACAQVLRLRYPAQASLLEPAWTFWLQSNGYGLADSSAEVAGRALGSAIDSLGAADVQNKASNYNPSGLPYSHEAPPNQPRQGFSGENWGASTPLLATRVADFPPPPGRESATQVNPTQHFRDDFARVKDKGGINPGPAPTGRTDEEEFVGIAWGYDGPPGLGTPPRLYLQTVLSVLDAIAKTPGQLTIADELAIIAGVGVAMADAAIDAWHYKYAPTHMMWRPAVGIRKAVAGNGTPDPDFLPLGRPDTNGRGLALTPDFPAYPSGHATFGGAAFQLLRLFLKEKGLTEFDANGVDNVCIDFVSDEYNGINTDPRTLQPRPFKPVVLTSLWQAIIDNSVSRVYLGVHWQFDGITTRDATNTDDEFGIPASPSKLGRTGGVWLGTQIANQIARKLNIKQETIDASKTS
jgi:vanadium chloroperoxidase